MFEINLIKNRIHFLSKKIFDVSKNLNFSIKKERLENINFELMQKENWNKLSYIYALNKERSCLLITIDSISKCNKDLEKTISLLILLKKENKIEILQEIYLNLDNIEHTLSKLELYSMFSHKYDDCNCYVDIQSGSGGIEAQDWANIILKMYLRWTESHNFKTDIIEKIEGEIVGVKSATIKVIGKYAYGWLRTESGIHRLVRKSPFCSNHRRHTSFCSVFIYPEFQEDINIKINMSDLRIDVYRASGAGGQHVNKTESAVRITHIPTNITTQCQSGRSQHKNKDQAMKQLKSKLYNLELQKQNIKKQKIEDTKSDISWGNQIRSYILDDSRIKDLRTGLEINNVQLVLNGDLDAFIKCSLKSGL